MIWDIYRPVLVLVLPKIGKRPDRTRLLSTIDKRQDQDSKSLADLAEETGLQSLDPYLPEYPTTGSSHIQYEDPFTPEGYKGLLQVFSKGAVSPPVTFANPEYFFP